jgi:hypothetical protein
MIRTKNKYVLKIVPGIALIFVLLSCAVQRTASEETMGLPETKSTQTLEDYRKQLEAVISEVDPSMFKARAGKDWMRDLTVDKVTYAVNDSMTQARVEKTLSGKIKIRNEEKTKVVKLDYARGWVRYINKDRAFKWTEQPQESIPMDEAHGIAAMSLKSLGLPTSEWGSLRVDTIMGQHFDIAKSKKSSPPFERERLVTLERRVNGYLVFEEYARLAVSNKGEVARLLTVWPRFQLRPDLKPKPKQQTIDETAKYLYETRDGQSLEIGAELAYVKVGAYYIPAHVITVVDNLVGEDIVAPAVLIPEDQDLDGIENRVDNCPDQSNPDQLDRDHDGVGDRCDVCPDIADPKQPDSNADGTGDMCEVSEVKFENR